MADVSGTWLGTYWQGGVPTRFEATLVQGGQTISGSILDDGYLGEAQVQGQVQGRSIDFIKRYLTSSPDIVQYVGLISENGETMSGTWSIDLHHSGRWEAHRQGDNLVAELLRQLAKPTRISR